jgi:hypothetical protein
MTESAENLNKWGEVTKNFDPMYARSLSTSWAANYDFDDDPEKYKQVFIAVKRHFHIYIDFSMQQLSPTIFYVDKLSIASRRGFSKAFDRTVKFFVKNYERYPFPPEIKNFYFTVIWVNCIRDAVPATSYEEFPVYVFPAIAEAIIEHRPEFFNGINVQIIKNTWE